MHLIKVIDIGDLLVYALLYEHLPCLPFARLSVLVIVSHVLQGVGKASSTLTSPRTSAILHAMLQHYQHVIWDWNGTLFDDAWLSVEIINGILRKRGLPVVDRQRYQQEFDFPVQEYYSRVGLDFSREPYEVLAAEFMDAFDRRWRECGLQRFAREVVGMLTDGGVMQTVLSACEQTRLETMISTFPELQGRFTQLVGLDHYYATSKVENGIQLIEALAHDPTEIVLIGDTVHDFETAHAMGIDCLLIPSGHHSREKLARCDARLVESLADLLDSSPRQ